MKNLILITLLLISSKGLFATNNGIVDFRTGASLIPKGGTVRMTARGIEETSSGVFNKRYVTNSNQDQYQQLYHLPIEQITLVETASMASAVLIFGFRVPRMGNIRLK